MDTKEFEKLYASAINSVQKEDSMQHMASFSDNEFDNFEDLDDLLDLNDKDGLSTTHNFKEDILAPKQQDNLNNSRFSLTSIEVLKYQREQTFEENTLEQILLEDMLHEDYQVKHTAHSLSDTWKANFNEEVSDDVAAVKMLQLLYGLKVENLNALTHCDRKFLSVINLEQRDLTTSEIETLKESYQEDWFDAKAYKLFALAERNTSLLLQAMQENKLHVEDLASYADNEEVLNAYLILVLQNRYSETTFKIVAKNPENLGGYIQTCLTDDDSDILFLCEHDDFGKILELIKQLKINNRPIPYDLLHKYEKNPYLYYIVVAYADNFLNEKFIANNLTSKNPIADQIAEDYVSKVLDLDLVNHLGGHYYIAKLISELNTMHMYTDKVYAACESDEKLILLNQFSQLVIKEYFMNSLEEVEFRKLLTLISYDNWLILIKEYVQLSSNKALNYSLFCFNYLLKHLLDININAIFTGSLLEIFDGKSCKFLSIESALHNVDALCSAIYAFIPKELLEAKILPGNYGIFLGNKNIPLEANPVFSVFTNTASSIENYVWDYPNLSQEKIPDNVIQRYNLIKVLKTVDSVTSKVEQLVNDTVQKYLKYDRFFDAISKNYAEYSNLLKSNQFFSLYNIFILSLNYGEKPQQFLAFILTLCKACCPDWCKVYNYHPEILRSDTVYCICNSTKFSRATSKTILENINSFILEVARLKRVQIQIMNPNEIEIRGVN